MSRLQLEFARTVIPILPPLIGARVRSWIYPWRAGIRDGLTVRTKAFTGSLLECRTSDFHGCPFAVQGYFDWRNTVICAAVWRGGTVIEVGANVGTETVSFADITARGGRLIALEPEEANFECLRRMVEINGFAHVHLIRAAAAESDGEIRFQPPANRQWSGTGRVSAQAEAAEGISVPAMRLDSCLPLVRGRVDAVFADVEGYEPAVLRGAKEILERHRPVVVVEASPRLLARNGWSPEVLYGELAGFDYRAHEIARFGLSGRADLRAGKATNWVCFPEEDEERMKSVRRALRWCGWAPLRLGLRWLVE